MIPKQGIKIGQVNPLAGHLVEIVKMYNLQSTLNIFV